MKQILFILLCCAIVTMNSTAQTDQAVNDTLANVTIKVLDAKAIEYTRYLYVNYEVQGLLANEQVYVDITFLTKNKPIKVAKSAVRGDIGWLKKNGIYQIVLERNQEVGIDDIVIAHNVVPMVGKFCPECSGKKMKAMCGEDGRYFMPWVTVGSAITAVLGTALYGSTWLNRPSLITSQNQVEEWNEWKSNTTKNANRLLLVATLAYGVNQLAVRWKRTHIRPKCLKVPYKYERYRKKIPKDWKKNLPKEVTTN
jgi:hypothetical protein